MTIGFDGSRAFVENRTGTENYSYQLLKALAKIDIENYYLVYLRRGQHPGKNWPENFEFVTINYPRLWTQLGLALRTFIDPLDVLFVPAHTLPLIRKPGLKTVITVHDLGAEYLPGFHQLKQILYLKFMTHYQLKSATRIIAVSQATKKDLIKQIGINSEKIKVVYEGVAEEFRIQNSEFRIDRQRDILKSLDIIKGKYFLFVGTIQPRKNLKRLIIAFKDFLSRSKVGNGQVSSIKYQVSSKDKTSNHPLNTKYLIPNTDFRLVLAGEKGWNSENIYSLSKELDIADKVVFTGRVSDQDLASLYHNAAALTYPSLFEGFGLPILEAFASGCPVITSNISSMPEVAGGASLLVNPKLEEEISSAMTKIISDDGLRIRLIQKGYERLKFFNWEKSAKETVKILTEAGKQT